MPLKVKNQSRHISLLSEISLKVIRGEKIELNITTIDSLIKQSKKTLRRHFTFDS